MLNKKNLFIGLACSLVLLLVFIITLPDGKLRIVFCAVGQGDAAYIKAPDNLDLLIDGGPDSSVLNCLGRHMSFYDRTLDVVVLTHPQADHLEGLIDVLDRFKVKNIVMPQVSNDTKSYWRLQRLISEKKIKVLNLNYQDKFFFDKVQFAVLWPEKKWTAENISPANSDLSYLGDLNSNILGLATTSRNINDFSYYLHLKYDQFDTLFTGDGDSRIQPEILSRVDLPRVEVLKYPHHGSKYGATKAFLDKISPSLAVISVGKNQWGHPNTETLSLLKEEKVDLARTDEGKDIIIVSDGQKWWLN